MINFFIRHFVGLIHNFELKETNERIRRTARRVGDRFLNNSPNSCVNGNTVLGDDVSFNGMRIIGNGNVSIGSHFHCAEGCYIISDNHDYDGGAQIPYDSKRSISKDTIIEDNVWLGTGVIVLAGSHIHEGAIIQAGSVVIGDIPRGGYCRRAAS